MSEFKSDGCTLFPDTINGISLLPPCVAHDYAYWQGGPKESRLKADKQLRSDVRDLGMPVVAEAMYRAVRLFGGRYWKSPKMWGKAWPIKDYGYGYSDT